MKPHTQRKVKTKIISKRHDWKKKHVFPYIGLFRLKIWNFFRRSRTPPTLLPVETSESFSFGKSNVCCCFFRSIASEGGGGGGGGGGQYLGRSFGGLGARRLTRRRRLRSLSPGKLLYRLSSVGVQPDLVESVSSAPLVSSEAREPLLIMTWEWIDHGKFTFLFSVDSLAFFVLFGIIIKTNDHIKQ
jgi:hypothetical protein